MEAKNSPKVLLHASDCSVHNEPAFPKGPCDCTPREACRCGECGPQIETINIVFDGPPGPKSGRFVEVEDMDGAGMAVGEWIQRENGWWVLRIDVLEDAIRGRA